MLLFFKCRVSESKKIREGIDELLGVGSLSVCLSAGENFFIFLLLSSQYVGYLMSVFTLTINTDIENTGVWRKCLVD